MPTARLKMTGNSPYKMRRVADLVRGLEISEVEGVLKNMSTPLARKLYKLIMSAVANAEHNNALRRENLRLARITVDGGTWLKRYKPRARGRAGAFNRPTSHITVTVEEV